MTLTHAQSHTRILRRLAFGILALMLPASVGWAATVNWDTCETISSPDCIINPGDCTPVPATFNVAVNDTIDGVNDGGSVVWEWDATPTATGCSGSGDVYTCNGITVDISGDPVTLIGANPTKGSFSFGLEGDNGPKTCFASFIVTVSQPFDLVAVLDRSGSMNWDVDSTDPAAGSRWNDLKSAVGSLMGLVDTSTCKADGRIGMTLFATKAFDDVDATFHYNDTDFHNNLLAADLVGLSGKVTTELNSQTPSGATAMGQGLADGVLKFSDNSPAVTPAPPDRSRTLLLFSDGEQNVDPLVDHTTGTNYTTGGVVGAAIAPPAGGPFKVVSVGIGGPAGDYHAALNNVATAHGGNYFATNDFAAAGIQDQLDLATQDLLAGCSPQLTALYSGVYSGPFDLPPFPLNEGVDQLVVKVSYSQKFETPQLVQLLARLRIEKDSSDVTGLFQPSFVGNFGNTVLLRADFSDPTTGGSIAPEGSYTVKFLDPGEFKGLGYQVVAFADEKHLAMDWGVEPAAPVAEGSLQPTMRLSWLGTPLTGASVEAVIRVPGDDLGDALANDPLTVDPSSAPDAGSPGYQKFLELLANEDFRNQMQPGDNPVTLVDQGDGSYTATVPLGDVSGVYDVHYTVTMSAPFGELQRLAKQSVYVRYGDIDLDASEVTTTADANGVTIRMRPRTGYGRLIGPAQAGAISVAGAGISVTNITDHQDGRYTIRLDGAPDAEIEAKILTEVIYEGEAGEFGPDGGDDGGRRGWLFWLVLILVIIVLIWLLRKLFR